MQGQFLQGILRRATPTKITISLLYFLQIDSILLSLISSVSTHMAMLAEIRTASCSRVSAEEKFFQITCKAVRRTTLKTFMRSSTYAMAIGKLVS